MNRHNINNMYKKQLATYIDIGYPTYATYIQ